jgi:hypothetical protein
MSPVNTRRPPAAISKYANANAIFGNHNSPARTPRLLRDVAADKSRQPDK